MSSPPPKTPPMPPGCRRRMLLSRPALLPQIDDRVPGDLPNQMRWFFLEVMHLDVLYSISKIKLDIIAEVSRICFVLAVAPCSGSNQHTPW
jgi:hypothetical protein